MIEHVLDLGNQLKKELETSTDFVNDSYNDLLIVGMGGSGVAGDVLKLILNETTQINVEVRIAYGIPELVADRRPKCLFISYSGNTEETVAAVNDAIKNNLDWSPERNEKPLSEDLINCHAMVSFHSMSAVHAVMAGIPSYCSEHSPAYPVSMSLKELDQIEDPLYAGDRQDWVKSLMCAQFTETEMSDKKALAHLNGENKW